MVVENAEDIDWEPLRVLLFAKPSDPIARDQIASIAKQWLHERDVRPMCSSLCTTKFLFTRESEGGIELLVQWVCPECLTSLLDRLASQFPQIERAVVGFSDPAAGDLGHSALDRCLVVPSRSVTMEDGTVCLISAFEISSSPVSVREYSDFCRETGYVTVAERSGLADTFRRNGPLTGVEPDKRPLFEAMFLSYEDATAYCDHKQLRLPTDPEVLAAITIDDQIRDLDEQQFAAFAKSARVSRALGTILTATSVGDKVVVRNGPDVTKRPGWNNRGGRYRRLYSKTACVGVFFVCPVA